jgi:hypothetical protein
VQGEYGVQPGETRCDKLRTAAEPGEEMWLDEAGRDPDVGLDPVPVQPHGHTVAVRAAPNQRCFVPRIVVHDRHGVDELIAQHAP